MGGLPVREAPLTNTDEKGEICSESVEFAQTFTKCLQYWEMVVRKWAFGLGLWAPDGGGSFDCGLASPPTGGVGLGYSIACTARRRGVSFARARRRVLRSMSGRYSYGIDNPPTLRRSSFPQRVVRPVGVPDCKTGQRGTELSPLQTPLTLGCAGYEYCFSAGAEKQIRTARRCAQKVSATHFYRPRAGARRANHHPSLALVAPMSHCFAYSLALLLSLPKELSLYPPPAALQFLAPQRRGTMPPVG